MSGFRKPEQPRDQGVLFPLRLDESLSEDHPARHLLAILESPSFEGPLRKMVRSYRLSEGRPPYHPKYMVALYLYGMMSRVRSSRQLENACHHRIDFMWLMEGQKPDHTTIHGFVHRHKKVLPELFRKVLEVGALAGLVKLRGVAVDGTLVRANAAIGSVKRREKIKELAAKVDETAKAMEKDWEAQEAADEAVFGQDADDMVPPRHKDAATRDAALRERKARLDEALAVIDRRVEDSEHPDATKAKTSTTDPESRFLKGKDGTKRPHFNAQVAVDIDSGMVVADGVTDSANDFGQLTPMIEKVEANCGRLPETAVADSGYTTGAELERAEAMQVKALLPERGQPKAGDSDEQEALRSKIAQGEALTESELDALPVYPNGLFGKRAFVYDKEADGYRCPMGVFLAYSKTTKDKKRGGVSKRREYGGAPECAECPLAARCYKSKKKMRTVSRDQYEHHRERSRERMMSEEGQKLYAARAPVAERPFAQVKGNCGINRFLRRGLEQVRLEWSLLMSAINLSVLISNWDKTEKALKGA